MSAASDVGPATWSSQESTSASECVKSKKKTQQYKAFDSHVYPRKKHTNRCAGFFTSSVSPDRLNCAFDLLQQFFFFFILYVTGMECHTVRQITTPSME